jgi:hypothetical protein
MKKMPHRFDFQTHCRRGIKNREKTTFENTFFRSINTKQMLSIFLCGSVVCFFSFQHNPIVKLSCELSPKSFYSRTMMIMKILCLHSYTILLLPAQSRVIALFKGKKNSDDAN